jgi:hypothetical protein
MEKTGLERVAPLSGIIGAVAMVVAAVVTGLDYYLPPAEALMDSFSTGTTRILAGGYIGILASALVVWFSGSVWQDLRRHESGSGRVSGLAFAGGTAAGLSAGLGFAVLISAASRVAAPGGLDPVGAVTLYDLYGNLSGTMFAVTLAVMIGATALVSLRHAAFPGWFAWISVVLALLLLSPFGYVGLYVAIVWIAAASVWIYLRGRSAG